MNSKLKRAAFNLSYNNSLSFEIGDLVPIYLEDVLPSDKFIIKPEFYIKFAPLVFPVYQQFKASIHYFFVPNRLAWSRFEEFITGGRNGTSTPAYPVVEQSTLEYNQFAGISSLADYLGFPSTKDTSGFVTPNFDAIPFFDYQFIYDEFFRDPTLDVPLFNRNDGVGDSVFQASDIQGVLSEIRSNPNLADQLFSLRKRCWKKDYFTTATPWVQRGPDIRLPFNDIRTIGHGLTNVIDTVDFTNKSTTSVSVVNSVEALGTLNDFYKASALQRWLQRNASSGSRYVEQILAHFGVHVPDYRLNRPQYLGGCVQDCNISEITQTSQTSSTSPLGQFAGRAVAAGNGNTIKFDVPEHGYIIGLLSVLPMASYSQGLRKNLRRTDRFDFFFKDFQGIGQQPVMQSELYNNSAQGDRVFGYQERYAEYKFHNNEVHGDFRDTLADWTDCRIFTSAPVLNSDFVHCDNAVGGNNRIFAVPAATSHLYATVNNVVTALRPMSPFASFHTR